MLELRCNGYPKRGPIAVKNYIVFVHRNRYLKKNLIGGHYEQRRKECGKRQ